MMYFTTQTDGPSWPNPPWSTLLFRELLANKTFRTGFINRFCDQLNTAFQPAVVLGIIDGMKSAIEPEMTQQVQRWKIPSSVNSWNNYVAVMQNFASRRPAYARNHLRNYFGLSGEYLLTVNISGRGKVMWWSIRFLLPVKPAGWRQIPTPGRGDISGTCRCASKPFLHKAMSLPGGSRGITNPNPGF